MTLEDIRYIYTEALSIAKLLHENEAENVMKYAIEKAESYYKEYGVSPFIKSDKYDLYMLDYGWLVGRMADYYAQSIADESDEETIEYFRMRINDDFHVKSEYKNIRLLVNLFHFKEILYVNTKNNYAYNLCSFESRLTGKDFIFSSLILDGKWLEKQSEYLKGILKIIGNREQYILKNYGKNVFNVENFKNPNERPHQFE